MKINSYINSFPKDDYFNFIIDNYNTFDNNRHIYTKEHFEWYLSRDNVEYYECIYIEYYDMIISSLIIVKLKKNKNNLFYINFACVDKNFRNKGLVNLMIDYVKKNYKNELFYFYTVKKFKQFPSYKKFYFIQLKKSELHNKNNEVHNKKKDIVSNSNVKFTVKETSKFHLNLNINGKNIEIYKVKLNYNNKIYNNYYITNSNIIIDTNIINSIYKRFDCCDNIILPNYLNIDYHNLIFDKFDYNYIYLINAKYDSHLELLDTIDIF